MHLFSNDENNLRIIRVALKSNNNDSILVQLCMEAIKPFLWSQLNVVAISFSVVIAKSNNKILKLQSINQINSRKKNEKWRKTLKSCSTRLFSTLLFYSVFLSSSIYHWKLMLLFLQTWLHTFAMFVDPNKLFTNKLHIYYILYYRLADRAACIIITGHIQIMDGFVLW